MARLILVNSSYQKIVSKEFISIFTDSSGRFFGKKKKKKKKEFLILECWPCYYTFFLD